MNTKTNTHLVKLVKDLDDLAREHEAPIWRTVADKLRRPRKDWSEVNLSRIARFAKEGETVVVPGKLLGSGILPFGVTVAAFSSSAQAKKKIESVGGKTLTIGELASTNPKGSGIRIMG